MKILRFQWQGRIIWGILEEPDKILALEGDLYGSFQKGRELCRVPEVKLLAPAEPTIMVANSSEIILILLFIIFIR